MFRLFQLKLVHELRSQPRESGFAPNARVSVLQVLCVPLNATQRQLAPNN